MFVARFGEKLDSSRALHPPFASRYFVGGIPPPRLVRAWCRITRTRVSPFPCAYSSHASSCPDLPLRRVFFVAPALADVPSARLTLSAAKVPQRHPMLYDSSRRWLTLALFRPHHNLISPRLIFYLRDLTAKEEM